MSNYRYQLDLWAITLFVVVMVPNVIWGIYSAPNDVLKGNGMSILKCEQCRDGYLIVKEGKNGPFLGCTEYKREGDGCNRMMTYREYRTLKL